MKNLLKLEGAQKLSRREQQTINGGGKGPICGGDCRKCSSIADYQPCCALFPNTCIPL